ncbi:putative ferric-chelate reductase 1 [Megalobrama amblycephala]|uniref:putative ferric-chelate reductase 1 n=1 Tax=Megalobrama amblycephala TaxID=75352 RepID=UPI002013DBD2|nr:putative ferric-chelate reductase 1 [Megalobrama amblycephala]
MFLYVLLSCVGIVQCFPNGQVSQVCGSLVPSHGSSAQSISSPYTVTADKTTFKDGDEITVSLSSKSDYFEGFMLQANEVGSTVPIGTFSVLNSSAQAIYCNTDANRAVSHTSNAKKYTIQAKWTAPSAKLGNIEFRATFVKSLKTFWVDVRSSALTYTGTTSATVPSNPDCGKTKVCFSQPSNCDPTTSTGCYFMAVQASSNLSELMIEMSGKADGYVAIGFSDDQQMGNDDIYICGKDSNGLLQVQHAFSTGRSRPNILSLGNVTNIKTVLTNGNINCSFTSRNAISTSRATSTSQYYLMIASGPSSGGNIGQHTQEYVSSAKADLLNPSLVLTSKVFPAILKAHGALMLIAWMTTGSIGMIIARYLKGVAKDHGLGGKDFWFIAHVSLMALSVTATAIAFILVFSYAQDWSGGAHPVLGCLVMILSLIQPIVAAFRCEPQHERRFVFNWAHSVIALAIKALAVAAIFTGLALFEQYKEDGWMLKVMGGFITWEALMYILQDLNFRARKKDSEICSCGSMKPETVLLILFLMGNLAFLISLLVGIGRS